MNTTTVTEISHGRTTDGRAAINVEEAAKLLGISRASAYAATKTGDLPTVRIGHRLLVPVAALERMLAV